MMIGARTAAWAKDGKEKFILFDGNSLIKTDFNVSGMSLATTVVCTSLDSTRRFAFGTSSSLRSYLEKDASNQWSYYASKYGLVVIGEFVDVFYSDGEIPIIGDRSTGTQPREIEFGLSQLGIGGFYNGSLGKFIGMIGRVKITDQNDVLIHDLTPSVIGGSVCYLDEITGSVYYNSLGGELKYVET